MKTALSQMEILFRACADQTRLRILNMLASEREICVYPIVEVLKTNQPKVSRHLSYLKRAGLIADRKDGLKVYYRLLAPMPANAEKLIAYLTSACKDVPEMQQDILNLQTVVRREFLPKFPRQAKTTHLAVAEVEERTEIRVELL